MTFNSISYELNIIFYIYTSMIFINLIVWRSFNEDVSKDTFKWLLLFVFAQPVSLIMTFWEMNSYRLDKKRGEIA